MVAAVLVSEGGDVGHGVAAEKIADVLSGYGGEMIGGYEGDQTMALATPGEGRHAERKEQREGDGSLDGADAHARLVYRVGSRKPPGGCVNPGEKPRHLNTRR